jgi:hypothetical protein
VLGGATSSAIYHGEIIRFTLNARAVSALSLRKPNDHVCIGVIVWAFAADVSDCRRHVGRQLYSMFPTVQLNSAANARTVIRSMVI